MKDFFSISKQQFWIATIVSICVIIMAICYAWVTSGSNEKNSESGGENMKIGQETDLRAEGNPGVDGENTQAETPANTRPADEEETSGETSGGEIISSSSGYEMPVHGEIFRGCSDSELVYYPTLNQYMVHRGIDILAPEGTEVHAAAEGLVSKVFDDPTMGKTVWISHQGEITTVYSNLSEQVSVEEGDVVVKGQVIGTAGSTSLFEKSDEPHIHVEVLTAGTKTDPAKYFGNAQ